MQDFTEKICRIAGIPTAQFHLWEECPSTNDLAKILAREGAPHGTAVVAKRQTAGRGRLGRTFLSPEGGVYLSVILRPQANATELLNLTPRLAVASLRAVEEVCALRPQIKWINDLVINTKKVAGILTELGLDEGGNCAFAVCGIGINCNGGRDTFPQDLQQTTTSLQEETGANIDIAHLTGVLVREILAVLEHPAAAQMEEYRRHCLTIGQKVQVIGPDRRIPATAESVDDDGGLWVIYENGTREKISSGEVSVRGLYGYETPCDFS